MPFLQVIQKTNVEERNCASPLVHPVWRMLTFHQNQNGKLAFLQPRQEFLLKRFAFIIWANSEIKILPVVCMIKVFLSLQGVVVVGEGGWIQQEQTQKLMYGGDDAIRQSVIIRENKLINAYCITWWGAEGGGGYWSGGLIRSSRSSWDKMSWNVSWHVALRQWKELEV